MLKNEISITHLEKVEIAKQIKNISFNQVEREMDQLIQIGFNAHTLGPRCRTGNNIVDYFTFVYRLNTKGKYNINFYEFIENIEEFKKKKFIQTMLTYYETTKNKTGKKNEYIVLKEVYNICISAINIIRPLVYMEIYSKYINSYNNCKPKCILDFCAGWGGACVAASALKIEKYIGIEINTNLKQPYEEMINFLKKYSTTEIQMIFEDALTIDYSNLYYDFVFTSPPYYFIQKYENNVVYNSKKEMDELFYKPLFTKVYNGLQPGGYFIINVCKEVYENVLIKLFGEAYEIYPYKKSKRQNDYLEMVYAFKKPSI